MIFEQTTIKKQDNHFILKQLSIYFVGMTRFELATSGPPDRCATGLRHIPFARRNYRTRVQRYCFFFIRANYFSDFYENLTI